MSVLVLGSDGFIGTYLVDQLLTEGFEVLTGDTNELTCYDYKHEKVKHFHLDVSSADSFRKLDSFGYSVEAVVNLACLQPVNVSTDNYYAANYIAVNTIGMLNVLEWCHKFGVQKVVYTVSHRGVQGLWEKDEIITEQSTKALKYTGSYAMFAISECAAQDCMQHYSEEYGLNGITLRLPPVYGYGPHLEGYVRGNPVKSGFMTFIENAIAGKPIELWGDATRARDIVYVKDVVSAIILVLRSAGAHGLYNIASGEKVSLSQEANAIFDVFAPNNVVKTITSKPTLPNDIESFVYDISKAKKELQWSPRYDLKEMLYDIKREMQSGRFDCLIERRRKAFAEQGKAHD